MGRGRPGSARQLQPHLPQGYSFDLTIHFFYPQILSNSVTNKQDETGSPPHLCCCGGPPVPGEARNLSWIQPVLPRVSSLLHPCTSIGNFLNKKSTLSSSSAAIKHTGFQSSDITASWKLLDISALSRVYLFCLPQRPPSAAQQWDSTLLPTGCGPACLSISM